MIQIQQLLVKCQMDSDIDIPQLVVVGNQSCGKTSLISQLSGLQLPSGVGMTTRAPLHIYSKFGKPWSCSITITNATGNVHVVAETADASQLSLLVQKAQRKITDSISADYITLNVISDHSCSLVDLPGIIHSVERESSTHLIDLTRDIALDWISKPNVLIVAALSCKDDFENQSVFHLARQVDPLGIRTIGVLTKPDTIEDGGEFHCRVLLGEKYVLGGGYFMVKCPGPKDSKVSHDKAVQMELDFFKNTAPWSQLISSKLFGTTNLRNHISKLLASLVEASLPTISHRAQNQLKNINSLIDAIPSPVIGDPKLEVSSRIHNFCNLLSSHLAAEQKKKTFHQSLRKIYLNLKDRCSNARPVFQQKSTKSQRELKDFENVLSIDDIRETVEKQRGRELDGWFSQNAVDILVADCQSDFLSHGITAVDSISREILALSVGLAEDCLNIGELARHSNRLIDGVLQKLKCQTIAKIKILSAMECNGAFTMNSQAYLESKAAALESLFPVSPNQAGGIDKVIRILSDFGFEISGPLLLSKLSPSQDHHLFDIFASAVAYFDLSCSRYVDWVCMTIRNELLDGCAPLMERELLSQLLDAKAPQQIAHLIKEDSAIVKKRYELSEKKLMLENLLEVIKLTAETTISDR